MLDYVEPDMRTVTVKMEPDTIELIDAYALRHKMNRSEVIRLAVQRLIEEDLKNQTVPSMKVEKITLK